MKKLLTLLFALLLIPGMAEAKLYTEQNLELNSKTYSALFEDLNGDGLIDMLVLGYGKNTVLYQNKQGEFIKSIDHTLEGMGEISTDALVFDMDGDGESDVFITNYGKGNSFYKGLGDGNFEKVSEPLFENDEYSKGVEYLDIDGDDSVELIIHNSLGASEVFSYSEGDWAKEESFFNSVKSDKDLTFFDVDHDGDMDALGGNIGVTLYKNNGAGNFSEEVIFPEIGTAKIKSIKTGDINSDGEVDVFVSHGLGNFAFYTWNGSSYTPFEISIEKNNAFFENALFEDIDLDGDTDMILFDKLSSLMKVYKNDAGTFTLDQSASFGDLFDEAAELSLFEDLDRDGDAEGFFFSGENLIFAANLFDSKNLFIDGNMEDLLYNWRNWGHPISYEKSMSNKKTGHTAMYLDCSGVHAGIQQLGLPVEFGKKYRYEFWYNSDAPIQLTLNNGDSNADMSKKRIQLKSSEGNWQKYTREFRILDVGTNDFRSRVSVYDGTSHLDDFKLIELKETNIVKDSLIEEIGTAFWRGWGPDTDWSKTSEKVHSGNQAFLLDGTLDSSAGFVQTGIKIDTKKTYKLSFYYQVEEGAEMFYALGDNNPNKDIESRVNRFKVSPEGEWVYYERIVKGKWFYNPSNAMLRFSVRGEGRAFVDDIFLEEFDGKYSIIKDGDMEEPHMNLWPGWGGSPYVYKNENPDNVKTGFQSLHLDGTVNGSAGVTQSQLPLQKNVTYKLSFWYKINGGTLYSVIGDNHPNTDFLSSHGKMTDTDDGWGFYERIFSTETLQSNNPILRLNISNGEAFIDDVKIEEIPELEE